MILRTARVPLLGVLFALCLCGRAAASPRLYVIAVGNNEPPVAAQGSGELSRLLHADDDAAAIASLGEELGAHATLLTVFDAPSRALFPSFVARAVPPTMSELARTIAWHRDRLEADRARGDEPVVIFFFSGHGQVPADGAPRLALLDGAITRQVLYDDIIAQLPARFVHLVIDACHAEAVVRSRDVDLPLVAVTAADRQSVVEGTTLARFPHVGALVATSAAGQSHEWDHLQHGVFTFEILSALRGAADVNRDGRIEYSEVSAFIAAASDAIETPRARQDVQVHAPPVNPRAVLVDLGLAPSGARLTNVEGRGPRDLRIEDGRGEPLLALHSEADVRYSLLLPAGRPLFVRSPDGAEAELTLHSRQVFPAERLAFHPTTMRERDAVGASLSRGLFATAFGPTYYRGYVDARPELMAVDLAHPITPSLVPGPADPLSVQSGSPPAPAGVGIRPSARLAFEAAAILGATSLAFTTASLFARNDFDDTPYQRPATEALHRMHWERGLAIATGAVALASTGLGIYLQLRSGPTLVAGAAGAAMFVGPGWHTTW